MSPDKNPRSKDPATGSQPRRFRRALPWLFLVAATLALAAVALGYLTDLASLRQ